MYASTSIVAGASRAGIFSNPRRALTEFAPCFTIKRAPGLLRSTRRRAALMAALPSAIAASSALSTQLRPSRVKSSTERQNRSAYRFLQCALLMVCHCAQISARPCPSRLRLRRSPRQAHRKNLLCTGRGARQRPRVCQCILSNKDSFIKPQIYTQSSPFAQAEVSCVQLLDPTASLARRDEATRRPQKCALRGQRGGHRLQPPLGQWHSSRFGARGWFGV